MLPCHDIHAWVVINFLIRVHFWKKVWSNAEIMPWNVPVFAQFLTGFTVYNSSIIVFLKFSYFEITFLSSNFLYYIVLRAKAVYNDALADGWNPIYLFEFSFNLNFLFCWLIARFRYFFIIFFLIVISIIFFSVLWEAHRISPRVRLVIRNETIVWSWSIVRRVRIIFILLLSIDICCCSCCWFWQVSLVVSDYWFVFNRNNILILILLNSDRLIIFGFLSRFLRLCLLLLRLFRPRLVSVPIRATGFFWILLFLFFFALSYLSLYNRLALFIPVKLNIMRTNRLLNRLIFKISFFFFS